MSGGAKSGPITPLRGWLQKWSDHERRIKTLERKKPTTTTNVTATAVILTDTNGVRWRLGVTTSGATTWTQV